MKSPDRPVLRYFGGKWILAPWIIQHLPPHRIYVEPYGGAASVLLRKPRSYVEVYNDLDSSVVNLFRVLQKPDTAKELERLLRLTPFARDEFHLAYEPTTDPIDPPYVRSTRKRGHGYSFEMSDIDHENLVEFIKGLSGMVVLCGYESKIYESLGWNFKKRESLADGASPRTEVLWFNERAWSAQEQLSFSL